jgi:UDP-3-O-[3-hydroxymyristoyl] glucosamine N-acyltransferase
MEIRMSRTVSLNTIFDALSGSATPFEVVNEAVLSGESEFFICPVDQVPDDGRSYLSFVGRTAKDPAALLRSTRARFLIVDRGLDISELTRACAVRVENARLFMCEMLAYERNARDATIGEHAVIHESAVIGANSSIGNFTSIGKDVVIGESCVISDNVTLLDGVTLGNRVFVGPGCVIGTDGFGYEPRADGTYVKFPHIGGVVIGDDVEIGGNTVIDRGALGATIIESGVKIDNLVHISHNVRVGRNSLVIANAMIAGGVHVGEGSWIGPSSNILDRTLVGKKAFVGMGVSVIKSIPDHGRFTLKHFLKLFS